jgi:cofilin
MANLTGIAVADECVAIWNEFKMQHKYRFITFKFSDDLKHIVVDQSRPPEATYDDFLDALPPKDVRYAVYDYDFSHEDGSARNKVVFVVWAPDVAPAKRKMICTGSKVSLKNALAGITIELQANDDEGIAEKAMKEKCLAQIF